MTPVNYEKYHQIQTYTPVLYLKISSDACRKIRFNVMIICDSDLHNYLVVHDNLGWRETRSQQNVKNLHCSFLHNIKTENYSVKETSKHLKHETLSN